MTFKDVSTNTGRNREPAARPNLSPFPSHLFWYFPLLHVCPCGGGGGNETRPTANWPANNSFVVMNAKMKTKTNANANTKANMRKRIVRRSGHKVAAAAVATTLEVAATKCCNRRSSQWATASNPSETATVLALLAISIWPRASHNMST